ncbi:gamma-butyrobetaine dioxygenase [Allocatelliglobosispora scoriae]|uniref:Gamma-butyrobetaine dioxygenase n=1 Tax=Allocatelliglobosispora scoriae TaxID=643052 RepID=A0A841C2J4_9ACTN|nr:phosphonate degradation HD-domain oxygenase [Allocatelliglobosispora scoriae]MBB5874116.1 gamma-butyrobetaine dioxygenase [Allocatelliglobosispora scoriae]
MTAPFPALWLRDNCDCAACRDPRSGQKLFGITDLPADLAVADTAVDGDQVTVTFAPDGHVSVFDAAFLARPAEADPRSEHAKADPGGTVAEGSWPRFRSDPLHREHCLDAVLRLGSVLLRDVPVVPGAVLEAAAGFGYVRETNYGKIFEVRVEPAPTNLAFTSLAISPHTDNPYRDPVPTVQLLHCLVNDADGGESGLVDGFAAAAVLRAEDPAAFAILSTTPVTFRYADADTDLTSTRPMIGVDPRGAIREIRFNNRSTQPLRLPRAELDAFYAAYRAFATIIARPELRVDLRLVPGDCLVFDNTRMLHARTAFTADGARHLQGCYADLDAVASNLAVLRRDPVGRLAALFGGDGAADYLGEPVTLAEHMLQAATRARAAGADDALVAAALLHDIGHLAGVVTGAELMAGTDNRHGHTGADWLARWFPPQVTEPVRLHVAAKRYLCAVEPAYAAELSEASVFTLAVQGGPMTAAEVAAFEAEPYARAAVAVRRWDDEAKDPEADTAGFDEFRPLLQRLLR